MSLRDDVLPIISAGWGLVDSFGFSTYDVVIRKRVWSGGAIGIGSATTTDLTLTPSPEVQELQGDSVIRVSAITPQFSGGGYTIDDLAPSRAGGGVEYYYRVTGPRGMVKYELASIDASDAVEYKLTLVPIARGDDYSDF